MEVFGELKNAYLEKDNAGKTALGAICCGDNITSEFDATLTATPKVNVGNGVAAKRLIVSDELASVKSELQAVDSSLSDRIATLEASVGGDGLVHIIGDRMPPENETFQRASRNATSLFIDSSAATGNGFSYIRSFMTYSNLAATLPIPSGVASSLLITNVSVDFDSGPFVVGLNSAFNESWPAKGLRIVEAQAEMTLYAEAKSVVVHSQHACTISKFAITGADGSIGFAQIRVDTTPGGVQSFFVKSSISTEWTQVNGSASNIRAIVYWDKYLLWEGGSPNYNPYSFIPSTVGLFTVKAEVYKLV